MNQIREGKIFFHSLLDLIVWWGNGYFPLFVAEFSFREEEVFLHSQQLLAVRSYYNDLVR